MSKKNSGMILYYDWLTAMEQLSGNDVKKLLLAIRDFQLNGTPPPELKGKSKLLASLIFPSIERRRLLSDCGKRGAEIRLAAVRSKEQNGKKSSPSQS